MGAMQTKEKNMTKKSETKAPALVAWHVREGKAGGKAYWTRIGAAWPHQNGDGFTVQIDLTPLDGKIILLPPKAGDDEAGA
ncbi:hypothetical protein SAMN04487993_103723 [Salipiger marinus]|uniref:Uncharacterized protein n=2 Tax=Salipiger marinus TaxID=555512 RepID=A0A1G8U8L8_9RHOB|nr:hypothetical protein SAMN04487993_103723 [Salipiger marinus]